MIASIRQQVAVWSEQRRQLFEWLLQGVPREEMARRLGKNERTVYRLLQAMRQELLQFLPD
jgi:DNA-binding CsgD family transcriptional regulator